MNWRGGPVFRGRGASAVSRAPQAMRGGSGMRGGAGRGFGNVPRVHRGGGFGRGRGGIGGSGGGGSGPRTGGVVRTPAKKRGREDGEGERKRQRTSGGSTGSYGGGYGDGSNNHGVPDLNSMQGGRVGGLAAASKGRETDPHRLSQRQKQVDFGKNTLGYDAYIRAVPKDQRGPEHPRTPDITLKIAKRGFDGLLSQWRQALHDWDNVAKAEALSRASGAAASAPAPNTQTPPLSHQEPSSAANAIAEAPENGGEGARAEVQQMTDNDDGHVGGVDEDEDDLALFSWGAEEPEETLQGLEHEAKTLGEGGEGVEEGLKDDGTGEKKDEGHQLAMDALGMGSEDVLPDDELLSIL